MGALILRESRSEGEALRVPLRMSAQSRHHPRTLADLGRYGAPAKP
jgi:hypothetical protein